MARGVCECTPRFSLRTQIGIACLSSRMCRNRLCGLRKGSVFTHLGKHSLSASRLTRLQQIDKALVEAHEVRLGGHPIGPRRYLLVGFTHALFDYWPSVHVVSHLGETYAHGDLKHLLTLFDQWWSQNERSSSFDVFLIEFLGFPRAIKRHFGSLRVRHIFKTVYRWLARLPFRACSSTALRRT